MTGTLVFVPVDAGQARTLVAGDLLRHTPAFAVTDELLETFGLTARDDEDAERACLQLASVWGLAHRGTRLVLVAQVPDSSLVSDPAEAHNGGVRVSGLALAQVESFFRDDPRDDRPAQIAAQVTGLDVDAAWDDEGVQEVLRSADLLWHGVEELARVGQDD